MSTKIAPTAIAIASAVFLVHVLTIWNYGYFGDELYFIDCAKHLAWGYVDQPPLVPFIAWLTAWSGYALWALRLLPALAAAATVIVAAALAKAFGGGKYAQTLAAIAVALAPINLLLGSILSTSAFEPLLWTLIVYVIIRKKSWYAIAALTIIAFYAKYSIVFLILAAIITLLLTPQRRILRSPHFYIAAILGAIAIAPNVAWQAQHAWPILQVLHQDAINRHALGNGVAFESPNVAINAVFFIIMQTLFLNPLLSIVALWGFIWLAFNRAAQQYRFIAIAFVLLFALMVALTARGYYLAGFYPVLFAAGGVAIEGAIQSRTLQNALAFTLVILVALMVPFAIPILPVDALIAYSQALGISHPAPPDGKAHLVQPLFADEFGWKDMTQTVAKAYAAIPQPQRAQTAIFADGYMYAGALNFYGPSYGLPNAISGNNNYYLWGPGNYAGESVLAVGATDYPLYRKLFGSVTQVAVFYDSYRWMIEGPLPIYLCTKPRAPLVAMWPQFKKYGL